MWIGLIIGFLTTIVVSWLGWILFMEADRPKSALAVTLGSLVSGLVFTGPWFLAGILLMIPTLILGFAGLLAYTSVRDMARERGWIATPDNSYDDDRASSSWFTCFSGGSDRDNDSNQSWIEGIASYGCPPDIDD